MTRSNCLRRLLWVAGLLVAVLVISGPGAAFAQQLFAGMSQDEIAEKYGDDGRDFNDYLSYMYNAQPPLAKKQLSENDFKLLTNTMLDAVADEMNARMPDIQEHMPPAADMKKQWDEAGIPADQQEKMLEQMNQMRSGEFDFREQINNAPWGAVIDMMDEMDIKKVLAAQPQYNTRYQNRPVMDTLEEGYDALPDQFKEHLPYDQFEAMTRKQLTYQGLDPDDVTWSDVNDRQKEMYAEYLGKINNGEEIDTDEIGKMMEMAFGAAGGGGGFAGNIEEVIDQREVAAPAPPPAAAPAVPAAPPRRMLDTSERINIQLSNGNTMDGYLLPNETLGKDPGRYIGFRPAGIDDSGIWGGVMVFERTAIKQIVFFDDVAQEVRIYDLDDFLNTFVSESVE